MYVYEVKHLPSGKFYIGYESNTPVWQAQENLDPGNKFILMDKGTNNQLPVRNVIKNILFKAGTLDELRKYAIIVSKNNENNKFFLGLVTPNTKDVVNITVNSDSFKTNENVENKDMKLNKK